MPLRRGRGDITTPARPTPGQPIVSYPTPVIADVVVREDVQLGSKRYRPLAYGTPHPLNEETGLDLRLVWQGAPTGDSARKTVQRIYATPRTAQDTYNYALKFDDESTAHPIFIRTYVELRRNYAPLSKGSKFTGIVSASVTNGGSGYDPERPPTVVLTGGGGSGAIVRAVVFNEQVAYLQILNEGTGYTSAPAISFTNTSGGSGAAATAAIQPANAILTNEEMQRIENEDPKLASLFVRVHRVYKVLPGPITTNRRIGQDNLTPQKYRRLVRNIETEQTVSVDYSFPSGLVGDQVSVELQEQTVIEARLKIIEEIIALGADALLGGETNEYGPLAIYESVVNEGTAIDTGFLILKSSVTPFGNGKAVKITVKYPLDLAMRKLLERSIGQDNLIPLKYRRLVKHTVTNTLVDPAAFVFPNFLLGDQSEIKYIEESIYRARLAVVEEIVASTDSALLGGEGDEFGVLAIYESVVNEGTPIDQGFLIKHSSVTPFGNGKAVKITVVYTNALVAAVRINSGGGGYSNGTHTGGTFSGGGGSGATFTFIVSGGAIQNSIVITNPGTGYTALPTPNFVGGGGGAGVDFDVFLAGPQLTSRPYDEEMQIHYDESRQIVMVGTPDTPGQNYVSEETKALDIWRSLRTRTTKVPPAVDAATANISYAFRPYKFPGTLDALLAKVSDGFLGYRSAKADLVRHKIKTWWQLSATAPVIAFDEIVTDTIAIQGLDRVERFSDVLHDAVLSHINNTAASQFYPATTPSFSDYYSGTPSGTSTAHNLIVLVNPGAGGYAVGDHLTVGGTTDILITAIQGGGFIGVYTVLNEGVGGTYSNPVTAGGGSGSGAQFDVIPYATANYIPGTAWVGTERVIAASVTPEPQFHLWKVQTQTVIMR